MDRFVVRALPAEIKHEGPQIVVVADEPDSYPCRRCLQDASVGEHLLLISYDPFLGESPYRGAGPIYVHERACEPFAALGEIPEQLRRRLLSLRAYDSRHMLTGAEVVEGKHLTQTVETLFDDPSAQYIHVHNARPGCFAAR